MTGASRKTDRIFSGRLMRDLCATTHASTLVEEGGPRHQTRRGDDVVAEVSLNIAETNSPGRDHPGRGSSIGRYRAETIARRTLRQPGRSRSRPWSATRAP